MLTNLDRINSEGFCVDAVRLDNCHGMAIDGKDEVGVAGHRDESHPSQS